MKKLPTLIAILFFSLIYGQQKTVSDYETTISMEPAEVVSSAILSFEFAEEKIIKYIITQGNRDVLIKEINKNENSQILKTDFSFLENGLYEIRFIIDDTEVKIIPFNKI
ncbi:hypothetical protein [Aequorivita antarctica]|uniref:Secretion system C-terminal sorting domain-containing protein n=1 Tax=Aequorivita antarctica TaxID=153266 RepID=A0A5C6YY64_9FLAO|nr:hypothetical protein [Aequorivita antarctica]TXD72396.1 hypothetical protein ESU54_13340 [Aequorivita antarctica]SRX74542.1 hypothetical protein AEQU3_01521 [Aequorivita antarctica]